MINIFILNYMNLSFCIFYVPTRVVCMYICCGLITSVVWGFCNNISSTFRHKKLASNRGSLSMIGVDKCAFVVYWEGIWRHGMSVHWYIHWCFLYIHMSIEGTSSHLLTTWVVLE